MLGIQSIRYFRQDAICAPNRILQVGEGQQQRMFLLFDSLGGDLRLFAAPELLEVVDSFLEVHLPVLLGIGLVNIGLVPSPFLEHIAVLGVALHYALTQLQDAQLELYYEEHEDFVLALFDLVGLSLLPEHFG